MLPLQISLLHFLLIWILQYRKKGTAERDLYEAEFEAFKLGAMLQELRKKQGLT